MDIPSSANRPISKHIASTDNRGPGVAKKEERAPLPTDRVSWSSAGEVAGMVGKGVHGVMRATTGAASLALHTPQVVLGPLFTGSASRVSDAGDKAAWGYSASTASIGGAVGLAAAYFLDFGGFGQIAAPVAGTVIGSIVGYIATADKNDSVLAKAGLRRHEAGTEVQGNGAQKFGYALSQGYRSAAGAYYERGAKVADAVVAFTSGMAGAKPIPRE